MGAIYSPAATSKGNEALFEAFWALAQQQQLTVRRGMTGHGYDPIEVGRSTLKNALCVERGGTTFFTSDDTLWKGLKSAGFQIEDADLSPASKHNKYRRKVLGVTVESLVAYPALFEQIVRDSVKYVNRPLAGNTVKKN